MNKLANRLMLRSLVNMVVLIAFVYFVQPTQIVLFLVCYGIAAVLSMRILDSIFPPTL